MACGSQAGSGPEPRLPQIVRAVHLSSERVGFIRVELTSHEVDRGHAFTERQPVDLLENASHEVTE